jgi:hypothetical protein
MKNRNFKPESYFQSIYSYIDLDPVFFQLATVDDLMDVIRMDIVATYNYKNEMLYLLKLHEGTFRIMGINLKKYEFFKFNINEIITRVTERSEKIFNDLDGHIYQMYIDQSNILSNFTHLKRYMVVILTK